MIIQFCVFTFLQLMDLKITCCVEKYISVSIYSFIMLNNRFSQNQLNHTKMFQKQILKIFGSLYKLIITQLGGGISYPNLFVKRMISWSHGSGDFTPDSNLLTTILTCVLKQLNKIQYQCIQQVYVVQIKLPILLTLVSVKNIMHVFQLCRSVQTNLILCWLQMSDELLFCYTLILHVFNTKIANNFVTDYWCASQCFWSIQQNYKYCIQHHYVFYAYTVVIDQLTIYNYSFFLCMIILCFVCRNSGGSNIVRYQFIFV
eukprot:TRINITY_DN31406_c0_g1_i2.p2 TRINITY_DN31406_c0_g1~~TRINITY_DN31406_c0_g1_i2.p2  ORF type:complete len:259 (-),score=-17.96 TRINITY_DN31406_c0_g1_i2:234-1010(-)